MMVKIYGIAFALMGKLGWRLHNLSWGSVICRSQEVYCNHGLINYIDTKAKCRHQKKFTCQGALRHVFTRDHRKSVMLVHIFDLAL